MKNYSQIITEFKNTSLKFQTDSLDLKNFLDSEVLNPFEVYVLAKFLQLNKDSPLRMQFDFDNEVKHQKSFSHFFFYNYCKSINENFHTKSGIPLENYVPLMSERIIPKEKNSPQTSPDIQERVDLLSATHNHKRIVLVGEAGSGKTFTLEQILSMNVKNNEDIKSFPIYVDLSGVSINGIRNRINTFLVSHSNGQVDIETVKQLIPETSLLFLMDGIDEIADAPFYEIENGIKGILNEFPNSRFVISTRPSYFYHDKRIFDIETFKIEPLSKEQIKHLVMNYYDSVKKDAAKARKLLARLNENTRLSELLTNPYLLTLTCEIFSEDYLPQNEAQIYELFITKIKARDKSKENTSTYKVAFNEIRLILESIAFNLIENRNNFISEDCLISIINQYTKANALKTIDEIISRRLLRKISENQYGFTHQLWMTYFAASYFKNQSVDWVIERIESFLEWKKWDDIIQLFAGLLKLDEAEKLINKIAEYDVELACQVIGAAAIPENIKLQTLFDKFKNLILDKWEIEPLRVKAIWNLAWTKMPEAETFLSSLIKGRSYDEIIRKEAFFSLSRINVEKARKVAKEIIEDHGDYFRCVIVKLMERFASEDDLELLAQIIFNKEMPEDLRISSVETLKKIESPKTIRVLRDIIIKGTTKLASTALRALGNAGTKQARNILINICKDNSMEMWKRNRAVIALRISQEDRASKNDLYLKTLRKIDEKEGTSLASKYKPDTTPSHKRQRSEEDDKELKKILGIVKLGNLKTNKAINHLANLLDSEEELFRKQHIVHTLANIGTEEIVDIFFEKIKDEKFFWMQQFYLENLSEKVVPHLPQHKQEETIKRLFLAYNQAYPKPKSEKYSRKNDLKVSRDTLFSAIEMIKWKAQRRYLDILRGTDFS